MPRFLLPLASLTFHVVLLATSCGVASGQNRAPLVIDFGPLSDSTSTQMDIAGPAIPDARLHWLNAPDAAFARPELTRSRPQKLLDGVAGADMLLRATVEPGKWWMTLYLDGGLEDSSTTEITVNGIRVDPAWQAFDPPAEGRTQPQLIYRVLHRPVYVDGEGLRLRMLAGEDSVRALALTLIPVGTGPLASDSLMARLSRLGVWDALKYDPDLHEGTVFETIWSATDSLVALRQELAERLTDDPENAEAAYWIEYLDVLIKAEHYFAMRGWEWAKKTTGLGLFDRLHQAVMLLDGLLDRPDIATFPLRERMLFTRGRILYWLAEERGGREERAAAQGDLAWLLERYPDEPLLRMYNGERVETPDGCLRSHADSLGQLPVWFFQPTWSSSQREALCHMRSIAAWWTTVQQADNGEFGGKLGDDVELLRWWPPIILSGDTLAMSGWRRLADGVWSSDQISDGYADEVSDVEHSSEFISDTAPFMALAENDPEYVGRLEPSYRHFRDLWTGISDNGHRFFKSGWFSSHEIEMEPPKNRDVEYNTRATKAVRYLAWKTRDTKVIGTLHEWSRAWLSAALRTDKGKPAGIIPASVRFPDEAINGDEPTWYRANMFWNYFDWTHSAGSKILDQLLFTYTLTADVSLLEPMYLSLDLVRQYADSNMTREAEPGSPGWAARHLMHEATFWSVVSQWRIYTDDSRYDDLLSRFGTPYVRFRLTGNPDLLLAPLEALNEALRFNTPMRTYEAIHTDRVYLNESGWPGEFVVQAMLTGDGMPEGMSPYHAVTWPDAGPEFTALVTDSGPEELSFLVYSGRDSVTARIWQLDPGTYRMATKGSDFQWLDDIDIVGAGQPVEFGVSSYEVMRITFTRLSN